MAIARKISSAATRPLVVALDGELGAGKTQFARGFVEGVDAELSDWVASPTYALCNTYPSEPEVHHLDFYRLTGFDDLETVGFWELLEGGHVLIEWAERIPEVARVVDVHVLIRASDESEARTLEIVARSAVGAEAVSRYR